MMKEHKKICMVMTAVGAAAMIAGIAVIGREMIDSQRGARDYADALEVAGLSLTEQPPEEAGNVGTTEKDDWAAFLGKTDLHALREVNSDVTGWISIPETEVSYPVLQTDNNKYYLNRTWDKDKNTVGGIFMECGNPSDMSSFNTIIYGHKMRNESMFGSLKNYAEAEYWQKHPYVYVVSDNGVYRYDIFAAFESGTKEVIYRLNIKRETQKEELIAFCLDNSVIDTGIVPKADDRLLTLSTCTGHGHAKRWVVLGVLHGGKPFSKEGTMISKQDKEV